MIRFLFAAVAVLALAACSGEQAKKAASGGAAKAVAPPPEQFIDAGGGDQVKAAQAAVQIHPAARGFFRFRNMRTVDGPYGAWRAVCGETSGDGLAWKGFVHVVERGTAEQLMSVQQDGFTPAQNAACRPIVARYLGEKVNFEEADAAFKSAGCEKLDVDYWDTDKKFCAAKAP